MHHYDILIIGFGKAGKTLAAWAGEEGYKAALIEADPQMAGGTCINAACIPTKYMAERSAEAKMHGKDRARDFYPMALLGKRRLVEALRVKNLAKLASNPRVDVIFGEASFSSPKVVQIRKADGSLDAVTADKIFVNTGSRPFIPNIPGIKDSKRVVTSAQMLDLDRLPNRLIILGGSFIGLEFASIYANFGVDVTLVMRGAEPFAHQEPEIAAAIREKMENDGVQFLTRTEIVSVKSADDHDVIALKNLDTEEETTVDCELLLLATGRTPNTEALHAEKAGLTIGRKGEIVVNRKLETGVDGIWAMGDVTGAEQFTYLSLDDFRIVKSQLLGEETRSRTNRTVYPKTLFVNPPLAKVGLTEKEAETVGHKVTTAVLPAAAIPKAHILGETSGLLKIVIDTESDRLLGASLFCAESPEMIALLTHAIHEKSDWRKLRDAIYAHPTMTECFNELFSLIDEE